MGRTEKGFAFVGFPSGLRGLHCLKRRQRFLLHVQSGFMSTSRRSLPAYLYLDRMCGVGRSGLPGLPGHLLSNYMTLTNFRPKRPISFLPISSRSNEVGSATDDPPVEARSKIVDVGMGPRSRQRLTSSRRSGFDIHSPEIPRLRRVCQATPASPTPRSNQVAVSGTGWAVPSHPPLPGRQNPDAVV